MTERKKPPFNIDGKTITCTAPDGSTASMSVEAKISASGIARVSADPIHVGAIPRVGSIYSANLEGITMARDLTVEDLRAIIRQEIRAVARIPRG